jgi:hypothetical protein
MDILAHSLWTNLMYKAIPETRKDKKTTWWGIFFGIFPDLVAFTPVFAYIFYRGIFLHQWIRFAPPEDSSQVIPLDQLTHHLYSFSHSLVIWAAVFGITWLVLKKLPWPLLGWALHICIDIFSHSSQFYPTPFLFPLSKFHVNGWPWADPWFIIINYGSLLIVYILIVPRLKKKFNL